MATWEQLRAGWSAGWRTLYEQGRAKWTASVQADAERYRPQVEAFATNLATTRKSLDNGWAKIEALTAAGHPDAAKLVPQWQALNARYQSLAAGFYAEVRPVDAPIGAAPLVVALVVLGFVVAIGGIIWALVAHEYNNNLTAETTLYERELDARIAASKEGRVLQATTVPPPPNNKGGVPVWLVGIGLVTLLGVASVPFWMGRSSG